jgi:cleavage stimulation factor subunit 3
MKALFPDDPTLAKFSSRFVEQGFDPTVIRPIVSPATQTKIKAIPSIENGTLAQGSPPNRFNPDIPSPKRPLPLEDSDNEGSRPQKLARTTRDVSPLKGAAGRRLDQQKRSRQQPEMPLFNNKINNNDQLIPIPPPPPPPLPRDVMFLLSIIPKAETYHATKFSAESLVRLIRDTHIPPSMAQLPPPPMSRGPPPPQQMPLYQPNPPMQTPMQAPMQTQMQPPMHGQYNGQFNGRHRDFSSAPAPFSHTQTQSQQMSPGEDSKVGRQTPA